ncbi:MAG: hypothetical protein FJ164_13075 [Gammaproteobacteria bacterium]|nr:hypothetical protein [Gammaproteobacteria bacterium]
MTSAFTNTALPAASEPNGLVAVFWDDLNQGAGGSIRVGTVGSAPNRQFVVSWEGVPHYSVAGSNLTAQLVVEKATGDFVMNYADVVFGNVSYDYGRSATVGVEHMTGTGACSMSTTRLCSATVRPCAAPPARLSPCRSRLPPPPGLPAAPSPARRST